MASEGGSTLSSWLVNLLYTGGAVFAGGLLLLYVYQEKLLYFPTIPGAAKFTHENPPGYRNPGEFDIAYEDVHVKTKDGINIHAWLMKQPDMKHKPTIIFFHGNAGNIGYRLPNAVQMYRKLGCNVLLVDYRGFGHSEGEPTETGLQLDAEAVLDAMHARDDIDSSKIFLFGRSLGGAVSVFLAEKRPHMISGLILENTFLSISSMVDTLMPWLSYVKPIVLRIDWSNERRIKKISHPILFVAGLQDELVPHSHMKQLRVLASASRRVEWHEVPYGTHNDSWLRGGESYYQALRKFIESVSNSKLDNETCDASSTSSDQVNTEASIPSMLQQPLFSTLNSKKNE